MACFCIPLPQFILEPWKWRQHVSSKLWYTSRRLHGKNPKEHINPEDGRRMFRRNYCILTEDYQAQQLRRPKSTLNSAVKTSNPALIKCGRTKIGFILPNFGTLLFCFPPAITIYHEVTPDPANHQACRSFEIFSMWLKIVVYLQMQEVGYSTTLGKQYDSNASWVA